MIPNLHAFQLDLCERLRVARGRGARIIIAQAATGAGKTTIGGHLTKQAVAKMKTVLWLVHRRRLVDQISDRLIDFEIDHGIIMRDSECKNRGALVQVASRDTILSRCFRHEWVGMPPADLVIVDEFHHAADPNSEYRRILDYYRDATILGLTATPADRDGNGMGPWAQAIECALPTSQLVAQGFLVPVRVLAPDRKLKRGKATRGIAGDIVESWKQYAENRPTVVFFSRVQHSLDAVEAFKAAGISAVHMDADTPDIPDDEGITERDRILARIASGEIKVLCNVGIVGEGVDIPELGCCQIACEMGSRIRFLQACGRIMRTFAGKSYGILIDHAGAVFHHGFPDEDTEWPLEGNADQTFKEKHDKGETEAAMYCKRCELVYHGSTHCPQCGHMPVKPPKSIFSPPLLSRDEMLVEAERDPDLKDEWSRDQRIKTWTACLGTAANRNGTFKMANAMYYKKYGEWPEQSFPYQPPWNRRGERVADVFPGFRRRKKA